MHNDFPVPITSDKDLDIYQSYLSSELEESNITANNMTANLKCYIGNLVKTDCAVGNRLESKIGILDTVGEDFVILNLQSRKKALIPLNSVKFLTILQNNTKSPYF